MRLLPLFAAGAIGLFATAAIAQNMNTTDPNSAPGASSTGGRPSGAVNRSNTMDPNSAPGASSKGGSGMAGSKAAMDPAGRANTADPNSAPSMGKKKYKKHKHRRHM